MKVDAEFLEKYDKAGPRYTSYPPAPHFQDSFGPEDFFQALGRSENLGPEALSFYVHFPYCPNRCLYCGCTSEPMPEEAEAEAYFDALDAEIRDTLSRLDPTRPVTQIHFGGGTPNAQPRVVLKRVLDALLSRHSLAEGAEVAIECDPALSTTEKLEELRELGFNRVSFGIQDIDESVLGMVCRKRPVMPLNQLVTFSHALGFRGVNVDLVYGLPGQTAESFTRACREAEEADADRIVTFSYAHVPWVRERQKELERHGLPQASEKMDMFLAGLDFLTGRGMVMIGMDHYARPDDALSVALANNELHRNFQGYCTRKTTGQVCAFGASAISQLEDAYAQNERDSVKYVNAIREKASAIVRGYHLQDWQRFVRHAINDIMCNGRLDIPASAAATGFDLKEAEEMTRGAFAKLSEFEKDGLIERTERGLKVLPEGRLVVRVIAMAFDPMLDETENRYSRTV